MQSSQVAIFGLLAVCALFTGCASQQLSPHQPGFDNLQLLRQSNIGALAVGEFMVAPEAPAHTDEVVTVRGSRLTSPSNNSFAQYLKNALVAELNNTGKYDPAATQVVSGTLLENELNAAGVSTGSAKLAARFSVTRGGAVVYDKRIEEQQTWESSFHGVVAIPEAINRYTDMYTRLLRRLFTDKDFKAATKAP